MSQVDVAIVGAGIAGISLAWHLQRAGKSVVILEKSVRAEGASVRNFGMVWCIGQPTPELEKLAIESREFWKMAAEDLGFWIRQVGSLHLAYHALELKVLEEYVEATQAHHHRRILTPEEVKSILPHMRDEGLVGALHSPTEAAVDPREVVHAAARALPEKGVEVRFDANVVRVESGRVELADGQVIHARQIVVCPGPHLAEVLPAAYAQAGLKQTHLQMMRLVPKPGTHRIGIHLCAGLTQSHYANFANCPTLSTVKQYHLERWPLQVKYGIHVLVSEHADGTLTVGDSHVYGRPAPVYQSAEIDDAVLDALGQFLPLENYTISERWIGTYNTHATRPYWLESVGDSVWALNLFGTGMTLSFGATYHLAKTLLTS